MGSPGRRMSGAPFVRRGDAGAPRTFSRGPTSPNPEGRPVHVPLRRRSDPDHRRGHHRRREPRHHRVCTVARAVAGFDEGNRRPRGPSRPVRRLRAGREVPAWPSSERGVRHRRPGRATPRIHAGQPRVRGLGDREAFTQARSLIGTPGAAYSASVKRRPALVLSGAVTCLVAGTFSALTGVVSFGATASAGFPAVGPAPSATSPIRTVRPTAAPSSSPASTTTTSTTTPPAPATTTATTEPNVVAKVVGSTEPPKPPSTSGRPPSTPAPAPTVSCGSGCVAMIPRGFHGPVPLVPAGRWSQCELSDRGRWDCEAS